MLCNQTTQDRMRIMSRFVRLKSILFNLSCVFFIFFFSERWQATLFQIFFPLYIEKYTYTLLLLTNTTQELTCNVLFYGRVITRYYQ